MSPGPKGNPITEALVTAARRLRAETSRLEFGPPVAHVYNPLVYAWAPYEAYLRKFGATPKRIVFLGMNPGPFGMVQTGVPFGEVAAVRDWLKIECPVGKPAHQHPRRPVSGFACARSEVSGRRLWGLFADRFGTPERFFAEHIVMNYCPLAFVEEPRSQSHPGQAACLRERGPVCRLRPASASRGRSPPTGVAGRRRRLCRSARRKCLPAGSLNVARILHPSPASPAANRNWSGLATRQLKELGVWD